MIPLCYRVFTNTILLTLVVFILPNISCSKNNSPIKENINLGKFSVGEINEILNSTSQIDDNSKKIEDLSNLFMDTPYLESTLIGDNNTDEVLTVNLEYMDCFTYIDYVESLRMSAYYTQFKENLRQTRYKDGIVSYKNRNHFFSDWPINNSSHISDVTVSVSNGKSVRSTKELNKKSTNALYLEGIPVVNRNIEYIPSANINSEILENLETGDYIGIYSDKNGLDVSHTGIIIKKNNEVYLRHASSRKKNRKVVDEVLIDYIKGKPGILVFRSR